MGKGFSTLQFVTCSLSSNIRRENFKGQEHIVVPVVALRENILEGHPEGDIFVSQNEIAKSARLWNDTVITVGHPTKNGQPVQAQRKEIIEEKAVGRLMNVEMNEDKLTGEMFLQENKLKDVKNGKDVLNILENDELLEVSTGYFSDFLSQHVSNVKSKIPQNADDAHVNIKPDHLALLPNSEGKCNVEDGCGAPRCNSVDPGIYTNQISSPRQPDTLIFDDTVDGEVPDDWPPNLSEWINAYEDETGDEIEAGEWAGLPENARQWISQHSFFGDADSEQFTDGVVAPVSDTQNRLRENALVAVLGGRGEAIEGISDQARTQMEGIARTLLENEFDRDLESSEENNVNENEMKGLYQTLKDFFTNKSKEDSTMDELVEKLSENKKVPFDNEDLEEMAEEQLQALNNKFAQTNEDDTEGGDEDVSENETKDNQTKEKEQPEINGEDVASALGYEDADQLRTDLEIVKNQREEKTKQKQKLVDELSANARCQFNKDELEQKEIGELKKLAQMADVDANHVLNGNESVKTNDNEDATDYQPKSVLKPKQGDE